METFHLTDEQSLRIADLPENHRVVGVDRGAPFVQQPTGQLMRIQRDGCLVIATIAARRRLTGHHADQAARNHGVKSTTPYLDVRGD